MVLHKHARYRIELGREVKQREHRILAACHRTLAYVDIGVLVPVGIDYQSKVLKRKGP